MAAIQLCLSISEGAVHYGLSLAWILSAFFPFSPAFFPLLSAHIACLFPPLGCSIDAGRRHWANFTAVDVDGEGSAPAISVSASLWGLPIVLIDRELLHTAWFHVRATISLTGCVY